MTVPAPVRLPELIPGWLVNLAALGWRIVVIAALVVHLRLGGVLILANGHKIVTPFRIDHPVDGVDTSCRQEEGQAEGGAQSV